MILQFLAGTRFLSRVRCGSTEVSFDLYHVDREQTIVNIVDAQTGRRVGFGLKINQSFPVSTIDVDKFRLWLQKEVVGFQAEIPVETLGIWELDDKDQIVQVL